ncbi:hypothetical protein DUI87_03785 [Hirundo rustica rustica]|uniref:ribonuclease H n=1 Tax=Hirundo rustica rustica TaxID=333673 RepID=A0A3M0L809_HIRRU|nr:hypothetical protein DUI87_03785 [Hirundo rustica rustica]
MWGPPATVQTPRHGSRLLKSRSNPWASRYPWFEGFSNSLPGEKRTAPAHPQSPLRAADRTPQASPDPRKGTEFQLWEAAWKRLLRDALPGLLVDPETAIDEEGNALTLDHLVGEGRWVAPVDQATTVPPKALEIVRDHAITAFFGMAPEGPMIPYSRIFQEPKESFTSFVERLTRAIELQVPDTAVRPGILREMAFTNANVPSRNAILSLPLDPPPTIPDVLRVCQVKVPLLQAADIDHRSRNPRVAALGSTISLPSGPSPQRKPLRLTEGLHLKDTDWTVTSVNFEEQGAWPVTEGEFIVIGDCKHTPQEIEILPGTLVNNPGRIALWLHCTHPPIYLPKNQIVAQIIPTWGSRNITDVCPVQAITEDRPRVECEFSVGGEALHITGLLDTGADVTVVPEKDWPSHWALQNVAGHVQDPFSDFSVAVTEKRPTQKLNWLTDSPVWVEQWLLSKEKLKALEELVEEQLAKGHIVETNSPWNSPVFVIKKPGKDKWRLLHDLRQINNVIEDMGSLQPGMPSPTMLPENWNLAVIDIKDCFFQIPLHPDDAPHFAFSVPTINRAAPRRRYHWRVLPQGMKNSPSSANGFELQNEKVQRMPPWRYLGLEISKRTIVPQKLEIKTKISTLADLHQLCGSLNWWREIPKKDRGKEDPLLIIEWVFLSHQRSKRMTRPQELVAELIRKARSRIRDLAGCNFECIHIPIGL